MSATSSTERVIRHRAKLRATRDGAKRINQRGRSENRKHHLKVKKLKLEIAAYERLLGIESKNQTTASKSKPILPPEEELRRMSMAELTEWKRQHRIIHRRRLSQESGKENGVKTLEKRLLTLQDMRFLVQMADDKSQTGDSTISGRQSSDSDFKEEFDATRMQGIIDDKDGDPVRTNGLVPVYSEFNAPEESDLARMQVTLADTDAYMVWLNAFVPTFQDSKFSEEIDSAGMEEITDVIQLGWRKQQMRSLSSQSHDKILL